MPIATLQFNLPEESAEFQLANDGVKWMSAMWDLDQELRSKLKYEDENMSEETYDEIQKTRDFLWEKLRSYGLTFDNL